MIIDKANFTFHVCFRGNIKQILALNFVGIKPRAQEGDGWIHTHNAIKMRPIIPLDWNCLGTTTVG